MDDEPTGGADSPLLFVCAFAEDDTGGVVSFERDRSTGELRRLATTRTPAASYAAVHPNGKYLYTVNRLEGGLVTSFRIDGTDGELVELNRRSSGGAGPCYLSLDATGSYAFVANYPSGIVAMLPIDADGRLGEPSDVVEHEGSSVDPDRQTEPHPHSIRPGPANRFVYVPDLGTDRIAIYRIDFDDGVLRPAETPHVAVHDGAGPRHLDFHPNGRFVYLLNELDSTMTVFTRDAETGALHEVQTIGTLPDGFEGENYCADVHVHPSGQWVYGSNRGHDSLAIFAVDGETGTLRPAGHESVGGRWPRAFGIDPDGDRLYAGNRHSDSFVAFDVDVETGGLTPTGQRVSLPEPICFRFLERT